MHTTELWQDSHYYVSKGTYRYVAHHNGYFSGHVVLSKTDVDGEDQQEFTIPFDALKELFGEFVKQQHMSNLERASGKEIVDSIIGKQA